MAHKPSLEVISNASISNISSFLSWKDKGIVCFERISKQIYISVRSNRKYRKLDGKFFANCLLTCYQSKCCYSFYRFNKGIDSICINLSFVYPLYRMVTGKSFEQWGYEMLNTLKTLPVWKIVKQLAIIGLGRKYGSWCYRPMMEFLIDKNICFTNLEQLQLPEWRPITNYQFMEKFAHISAFAGHINSIPYHGVVKGRPNKLKSIHGSIESIDSIFRAFKIHKQIQELCLFCDYLHMEYKSDCKYTTTWTNYSLIENLERLRLTDGICRPTVYDNNDVPKDHDIKVLLQKLCGLRKLKWIDVYMKRGDRDYIKYLLVMVQRPKTELIIRFNYSEEYDIDQLQFRKHLIAFIQSLRKTVQHWMIIIRWLEITKLHKTIDNLSNKLSISYRFDENSSEYQITDKNKIKQNIRKYYSIKWIMNCQHDQRTLQ